tara:strand:- start:1220 stop:1774 length:555 start_codon:yes stop_codon:yes gene_type:complete
MTKVSAERKFETKSVPIHVLRQDPFNARKHSDKNIGAIKESLSRFGQTKAVVVAADGNTIIAGNCTWLAAKQLDWKRIVAVFTDLKSHEATAYAIADNKTTDMSEFDGAVLEQLLEDLPLDLLNATGFTEADLNADLDKVSDADVIDDLGLTYRVVVECHNEQHQQEVVVIVEREGLKCQKLIS